MFFKYRNRQFLRNRKSQGKALMAFFVFHSVPPPRQSIHWEGLIFDSCIENGSFSFNYQERKFFLAVGLWTTRVWTTSTYIWIFLSKFSRPFVSPGFAGADSTNRGLKTLFSHSQPQFPNHRFPASMENTIFNPRLVESAHAEGSLQSQTLFADFRPLRGKYP